MARLPKISDEPQTHSELLHHLFNMNPGRWSRTEGKTEDLQLVLVLNPDSVLRGDNIGIHPLGFGRRYTNRLSFFGIHGHSDSFGISRDGVKKVLTLFGPDRQGWLQSREVDNAVTN